MNIVNKFLNVQNILNLADLIEATPDKDFNMDRTIRSGRMTPSFGFCGSPACIAGWAAWEQQGRPEFVEDNCSAWDDGDNILVASALAHFGITYDIDDPRCMKVLNGLFGGNMGMDVLRDITNKEAAAKLRQFATTGDFEPWPGKIIGESIDENIGESN